MDNEIDDSDYADATDYTNGMDGLPQKTKEQGLFSQSPRSFVSAKITVTLSSSPAVASFASTARSRTTKRMSMTDGNGSSIRSSESGKTHKRRIISSPYA